MIYFLMIYYYSMQLSKQSGKLCAICLAEFPSVSLEVSFLDEVCYDCWLQHIKYVISSMSYRSGADIASPFQDGQPINICTALNTFKQEDRLQIEHYLFKKYTSFAPDIEKCPAEDCDYVFTLDACKWRKINQLCPKCNGPLSIPSTLDFKSIIGFIRFLFIINRCPKCEIPIIKAEGCSRMVCGCGHQFCWSCLKDFRVGQSNIYSVHEHSECSFIQISRIGISSLIVGVILQAVFGSSIIDYILQLLLLFGRVLILDGLIFISLFLLAQYAHYRRSILTGEYNIYRTFNPIYALVPILLIDTICIMAVCHFELFMGCAVILGGQVLLVVIMAVICKIIFFTVTLWFDYIV